MSFDSAMMISAQATGGKAPNVANANNTTTAATATNTTNIAVDASPSSHYAAIDPSLFLDRESSGTRRDSDLFCLIDRFCL